MNSKTRLKKALEHTETDRIPIDFGSSAVTGIHIKIVSELREVLGLKKGPVKLTEPYQMLGDIDDEMMRLIKADVSGLFGEYNMFGIPNTGWKEFKTPWDQQILVPGEFNYTKTNDGSILIYPEGNISAEPAAKMPVTGYFFNALNRQGEVNDSTLKPDDNLEEFKVLTEEQLQFFKNSAYNLQQKNTGVLASFGGTALGDIALVPAMHLKNPRGIRSVSEWYISLLTRRDYIHQVFDKQSDIALINLEKLWAAVGDIVDVVFICGTDFGTQRSQFCSKDDFRELYAPYYRKMNQWIHEHTTWKTFKHSCGAVEPFMNEFIDAGFDIINPVQINAEGMDPADLKGEYGKDLVFWGGGVDTQYTLPFGKPEEVRKEVLRNCEIFSEGGGFVFNAVHNIQANVPIENLMAMFEAVEEFNG